MAWRFYFPLRNYDFKQYSHLADEITLFVQSRWERLSVGNGMGAEPLVGNELIFVNWSLSIYIMSNESRKGQLTLSLHWRGRNSGVM